MKPPGDTEVIYDDELVDFAVELHEWLSLIWLESPRINCIDDIEPTLARYSPPGSLTSVSQLVSITWEGFFSPTWAHRTFVQALLTIPKDAWFAYHVRGSGEDRTRATKDCTILKLPEAPNEYMLWEVE